MKNSAKTLLIGYGNTLREDDGFGPSVAALLERHPGFECLSAYQLTPELSEQIASYERVVFVDVNAENAAGVFAVPLPKHDEPYGHALSPWKVMAMAQALFFSKADFLIFSAGGLSFGHKESLTPPLKKAAELLAFYLSEKL